MNFAGKERADERTRTAYPCSSYEFADLRSSLSLCVRKLRLFKGFSVCESKSSVRCALALSARLQYALKSRASQSPTQPLSSSSQEALKCLCNRCVLSKLIPVPP